MKTTSILISALLLQATTINAGLKEQVIGPVWAWQRDGKEELLRLKPGGVASGEGWTGTWRVAGERQIELRKGIGEAFTLNFNAEAAEFIGSGTGGKSFAGRIAGIEVGNLEWGGKTYAAARIMQGKDGSVIVSSRVGETTIPAAQVPFEMRSKLGQTPAKDLTAAITKGVWVYDHPTKKGFELRFDAEGKAHSASSWGADWRRVEGNTVQLKLGGRTSTVVFSADFSTFTGVFFDGQAWTGRRK